MTFDERPPSGGTAAPGPPPPRPTRQPVFNVPPATLAISAAVTVAFVVLRLLPTVTAIDAVEALSIVPVRTQFAPAGGDPRDLAWELVTLLSHALVHIEWLHIMVNIGFLLAFGTACERAMGTRRMVLLFLAATIAGGITQIVADWGDLVIVHGASGGVSGCFGGFIRLMLSDTTDPRRRRLAINLMAVLIVMNVAIGIFGGELLGQDAGVAWEAHLGGFAAGLVLARRRPRVDLIV